MSIEVIDNFANIQEQLEIINYINENKGLLYFFHNSSVSDEDEQKTAKINYPHVVHLIFDDNKVLDPILFSYVYNLLHKNKLSKNFIERIKVNINFPYPNNSKENYGPIHTDRKKGISIIYYVNNTDGDTVFFNDKLDIIKKVSPRQGRAIIFDSSIKHTGSCPINSVYRQVINFVLYK